MEKKNITLPVDFVGPIVFLVLSVILKLLLPSQVVVSEGDVVNGRMFPNMLIMLMLICCVVLLLQAFWKLFRKEPMSTVTINLLTEVRALLILGILFVTYVICNLTDLFVVGALFCSVAFLLFFRCKKPLYYVVTLGLTVAIWAAFRFGLNVRF